MMLRTRRAGQRFSRLCLIRHVRRSLQFIKRGDNWRGEKWPALCRMAVDLSRCWEILVTQPSSSSYRAGAKVTRRRRQL